jgi:glucokinase
MAILSGDIGATKTSLAIFLPEAGPQSPIAEKTYPSDDFPNLTEIVRDFLGAEPPPDRAVFGVAGPVVRGESQITNLPWLISEGEISSKTNIMTVRLINDLEATATAVPHLPPEDFETINEGQAEEHGAIAVIAPGTGLGEGFMLWDGEKYRAHASEGSHADFAPQSEIELELLAHLKHERNFEHVSYEAVCSGIGITNIYRFLRETGFAGEPAWLAQMLAGAEDDTPAILSAALEGKDCRLCEKTLEIFLDILAAEAGNLALKVLATGGVYVGGGLPPRMIAAIKRDNFVATFANKGKFKDLLGNVPIRIIMNPRAALYGAGWYALDSL